MLIKSKGRWIRDRKWLPQINKIGPSSSFIPSKREEGRFEEREGVAFKSNGQTRVITRTGNLSEGMCRNIKQISNPWPVIQIAVLEPKYSCSYYNAQGTAKDAELHLCYGLLIICTRTSNALIWYYKLETRAISIELISKCLVFIRVKTQEQRSCPPHYNLYSYYVICYARDMQHKERKIIIIKKVLNKKWHILCLQM